MTTTDIVQFKRPSDGEDYSILESLLPKLKTLKIEYRGDEIIEKKKSCLTTTKETRETRVDSSILKYTKDSWKFLSSFSNDNLCLNDKSCHKQKED